MNIIAVDDERYALRDLTQMIEKCVPDCQLSDFRSPAEALRFAGENRVDIAFLDIEMGGMSGLELAKRIRDINEKTDIVFVTGHSRYAVDAFLIPASGYILKPVSEKAILTAMKNLRNPIQTVSAKLHVLCFGNFDVFMGDERLHFPRSKSKELFAYLIHKRGTSCTVKEITSVLFENREETSALQSQTQTIISTMMKVLQQHNAKDIIIKKFNSVAVDVSKVDCDYYKYLDGDQSAADAYTGEYMSNYAWAEFTSSFLDKRLT